MFQGRGVVLLVGCFLFSGVSLAGAPIGTYFQFAPCHDANHLPKPYESSGDKHLEKDALYDAKTYRGELVKKITGLLSTVLHEKICMSTVDIDESTKSPSWWFLLAKPQAVLALEKQQVPIHPLKQLALFPNQDGSYCSNLVVKTDSDMYSMSDLKNKDIVITSYQSMGDYVYPHALLGHYFKENHIHFSPGQDGESTHDIVKGFFDPKQDHHLALIAYDKALEPYAKQFRVLMKFCGLPEYTLIANDKLISAEKITEISKALEKHKGQHFSWVAPNMKRLQSFQAYLK